MFSPAELKQKHYLVRDVEILYLFSALEEDKPRSQQARSLLFELCFTEPVFPQALMLYLRIEAFYKQCRTTDDTQAYDPDETAPRFMDEPDFDIEKINESGVFIEEREYQQWLVIFGLSPAEDLDFSAEIITYKQILRDIFGPMGIRLDSAKDWFATVGRLPRYNAVYITTQLERAYSGDIGHIRTALARLICLTICVKNLEKTSNYQQFRWLAGNTMTNTNPEQTMGDVARNFFLT